MTATLAAIRYRRVCDEEGGPIAALETGLFDLRGEMVWQANATLKEELAPKRGAVLFSPVDGSGTHRTAVVARHIAVSEAIERWALLSVLRDGIGELFGFGVDPTSNGMAAFPGIFARQARRFAWLEAVERYCLFGWWEGRLRGEFIQTEWAGVSGVEVHGPFPAERMRVVVLFTRTAGGRYAYGHAAGRTLPEAKRRALIEMCRHQLALEGWDQSNPIQSNPIQSRASSSLESGQRFERVEGNPLHHGRRASFASGGDGQGNGAESLRRGWTGGGDSTRLGRMEERSLYFSTKEGFGEFWSRVEAGQGRGDAKGLRTPEVVFDGEIPGPWSRYASVWRVVFRPESRRFLEDRRFFFW